MKTEAQTDKNYHSINEANQVYLSFTKGLKVTFHDQGNAIKLEGSLYTGSEKVLINDKIVSKKRNFRTKTEHHFQFDGNEYVLRFRIISIVNYSWTCSLFKNGALVKVFECKNVQKEQSFHKKHPEIILGGLTGLIFALGYISLNMVLAIVIVGTIFSLQYMRQFLLVRESPGFSRE